MQCKLLGVWALPEGRDLVLIPTGTKAKLKK